MIETEQQYLRSRIRFECEPLCIGVQDDAESLTRRIKEAVTVSEARQTDLDNFAIVYAATVNAVFTFDGKEKDALLTFKQKWEARHSMSSAELWQWRMHIPNGIFNLWAEDYISGQNLSYVDPGQLPTDKLTAVQREELKDPDSPLPPDATLSLSA